MAAHGQERKVMFGAGGALVLLAGFFLWRDLHLATEALLTVLAIGSTWVALREHADDDGLAGALLLAVTGLTGGLWYAAVKEPVLLAGLGVAFAGALVHVLRRRASARMPDELRAEALRWYALVTTFVAASWATYFEVFTTGFAAEAVGRRLVLTILWIAIGTAFVVLGRRRLVDAIANGGYALVLLATAKAVLYDTSHLDGMWRVACLAAAGGLLLLGGALLGPPPAKPVARDDEEQA